MVYLKKKKQYNQVPHQLINSSLIGARAPYQQTRLRRVCHSPASPGMAIVAIRAWQ